MYQPGTGYTTDWLQSLPTGYWLHSLVHLASLCRLQSLPTLCIQLCVDSGAGRQQISTTYGFNRPVTESTDRVPATQPALNSLLHISRLQNLPAYYQPAPRINQPTGLSISWPLFSSSLFTGLRLMTGLITCSP